MNCSSSDPVEPFRLPQPPDDDMVGPWLAAIVESAGDAIVSKTLEGIVTSWNRGAERLFGYTEEEMVGKPVALLIPEDHQDEEPRILARLRKGEKVEHYETVRQAKDGRLLDISLTVSPIRDAGGRIIGASKIARDITEQKRAEVRLQEALAEAEDARKQAEEAGRLKDEFLSTISHELRTPLSAVMGWVSMLRSGRLDEAMVEKAMETIERNVKAQAQLIEDLLDVSRIISGKLRIDPQPLALSGIIHTAVDSIIPTAEAKRVRLQILIDPGAGTVMGDPDRLQQVIWNLLSNAVKFTPGGGRVRVELERNGGSVILRVSDTGIGVNPEFLPHLFERFTQEDSTSTRSYQGLGMGLAIVKHITELHGGTVSATSEGVGKGTTFEVALPTSKESIKPPAPTPVTGLSAGKKHDLPKDLGGVKILVVDDEQDTCDMIGAAFEQCGSEVLTVSSATQALAKLEEWQPDILISDINMPHMNGYQLIRQIRESGSAKQARIPAVALTAMARIDDRVKALAAGFQMHVPKPVELKDLYTVVGSLVSVGLHPRSAS